MLGDQRLATSLPLDYRTCVSVRCANRSTGMSTMRPSRLTTPPPAASIAITTRRAHSTSAAPGANAATVGTEGYAEWRSFGAAASFGMGAATAWKLYDATLALVASGVGDATAIAATAGSYLEIFGKAGAAVTVTVGAAAVPQPTATPLATATAAP